MKMPIPLTPMDFPGYRSAGAPSTAGGWPGSRLDRDRRVRFSLFSEISQLAHYAHRAVGQGGASIEREGEEMAGKPGRIAFRIGVAVALAGSFLEVWINLAVGIVGSEDNPVNQGFYLVVAAACACAFTARLRADAMARAMLAVAGLQALLGLAVATAPSTARDPMGAVGVLALSAFFAALWLASAALFHRSARQEASDAAA
jgi:hypothetical protein